MDLESDWKALVKFWKERSALGRFILACGFLCSALPIASLADGVFELKGFIAHGIDFYRNITTWLYGWLATLLNINIPQQVADVLLVTLVLLALAQRIWPTEVAMRAHKWRPKDYGVAIVILFCSVLFGVATALLGINDSSVLALLLLIFAGPFATRLVTGQFGVPARRLLFATLGLYLAIAVIAAVSEGLSRQIV